MESVKGVRRQRIKQNDILRSGAERLLYFACGVLISRGAVMGSLAPFGASYAAAVPKKRLLPALLGSAFGYLLRNPNDSFRYIAVLAVIGALRWLLSDIVLLSKSRLFAPVVAAVPILATGVALLWSSTSTVSSFTSCVLEAAMAGAAAYFITVAVGIAVGKRSLGSLNPQETASLVITGCVLMLSLSALRIEEVSLGRIAAVVAVLLCARFGGVYGGAVSGIATGAVFSLSGFSYGFLCGGFAFGGLMAGMLAPVGKIVSAAAFVAADFLMSLAFSADVMPAAILIEGIAGATVFLVLPADMGHLITPLFHRSQGFGASDAVRDAVVMRLSYASKAITGVCNDVNSVAEKLTGMYAPGFAGVCENVAAEVCAGCGLRMYCYEHKKDVTSDDFRRLEEVLGVKGKITAEDIDGIFIRNCCKKGELATSMNKHYRMLLASREAQRRVADIRSVVAGQFAGVGDILNDLSKEFAEPLRSDEAAAERITARLHELGAVVTDCVCLLSEDGRMSAEIMLSNKGAAPKKGVLMREVSRCCGRSFDLPTVTESGDRLRVSLCELPRYDVEIGSDQHIADGGKLCGDCLDYFNDGRGNTCALVCDGMGTGGRAAVDGSMAVNVMGRLLRSGLSAHSALQIVNAALMVKSDDESLSTVDLVSVNLYTGEAQLHKAGAPMTFLRRGGRVIRKEMPSLPAGILNSIRFSSEAVKLSAGDMVVMVSDGVVTGDEKWLEHLIRTWNKGSSQELAQAVVEEAIRRRRDGKDDDITALAMRLTEK